MLSHTVPRNHEKFLASLYKLQVRYLICNPTEMGRFSGPNTFWRLALKAAGLAGEGRLDRLYWKQHTNTSINLRWTNKKCRKLFMYQWFHFKRRYILSYHLCDWWTVPNMCANLNSYTIINESRNNTVQHLQCFFQLSKTNKQHHDLGTCSFYLPIFQFFPPCHFHQNLCWVAPASK